MRSPESNNKLSSHRKIVRYKEIFLRVVTPAVPVTGGKKKHWVREDTTENCCSNLCCKCLLTGAATKDVSLETHYKLKKASDFYHPQI